MKLLASFDHVYACLCISAFVSVSLSEQSFLFTESPICIMEEPSYMSLSSNQGSL